MLNVLHLKMNKTILLIVSAFILVATMSLVSSYTAPNYTQIDLVLSYTAINYTQIDLVLDRATNTCTYSSGNWIVACSDNCSITSNVALGGNNVSIIGTGTFSINGGNISGYNKVNIAGTDSNNICRVYITNNGGFKD